MTRVYFHCTAENAALLVGSLTSALNQFQTPFQLKAPAAPALYDRADAAVLYVGSRYFPITARIVSSVREKTPLEAATPLFTKTLWPGVGAAVEPGTGESSACIDAGSRRKEWSTPGAGASRRLRGVWLPSRPASAPPALISGDPGLAEPGRSVPSASGGKTSMNAGRRRFLDAASRIGRRLCRDAVWSEGRCNWLGWAMEPHGGHWVSAYRAMGVSVYDGAAGIGLFLARLARLDDDPIVATTAVGALAQALTGVDALAAAGEYGFYSGLSGVAQCCFEAGMALGREDLVVRGRNALLVSAKLPPQPQRLDVINGSAGFIPALIGAAERFQHEDFSEAALRHGSHLVDLSARTETGWSWNTIGAPGEPHLLGFAHGASGIAYALGLLSKATDSIISLKRRARDYATSAPTFDLPRAIGPTCAVSCNRDRRRTAIVSRGARHARHWLRPPRSPSALSG